jgi:CARDB
LTNNLETYPINYVVANSRQIANLEAWVNDTNRLNLNLSLLANTSRSFSGPVANSVTDYFLRIQADDRALSKGLRELAVLAPAESYLAAATAIDATQYSAMLPAGFAVRSLSFPADGGYGMTTGVLPATGIPSTVFTYKVIYTDSANKSPSSVYAVINRNPTLMQLDTAASATLHDGDYTNGEQFVYKGTVPNAVIGANSYSFVAPSVTGGFSVSSSSQGAPLLSTPSIDLVSGGVSTLSSSVGVGGALVVNSTVTNQGNVPTTAGSFQVDYKLVSGSVSRIIGSRGVGILAAGASNTARSSFTVPVDLAPGVYSLVMVVDSTNRQAEGNESNNTATVGAVTVIRDVDLIGSVRIITGSVLAGSSVVLESAVTNQGSSPSSVGSFAVYYYLVSGGVSRQIGSRGVGGLAAGATSPTVRSSFSIAGVPKGIYSLRMVVDATNLQPERNEANNNATAVGSVTVN